MTCLSEINRLKRDYHQCLINTDKSLRLIYEERGDWSFEALSQLINDDQALNLLWLSIIPVQDQEPVLSFD